MSKHTPEPWAIADRSIVSADGCIDIADLNYKGEYGAPSGEPAANGLRIVACVNSLAGVADPEKAVQAAREALESPPHPSVQGSYDEFLPRYQAWLQLCDKALALLTAPAGAATENAQ